MGVAVNMSRKNILNAWELFLCDEFCVCSKFFCALRHIARQRAYDIYDAIIYSKRPLLRLRPLPSNNELSAAKALVAMRDRQEDAMRRAAAGLRTVCYHRVTN